MSEPARRCTVCDEPVPSDIGCTASVVQLGDRDYPVRPHDGETTCAECGTPTNGHHHGECPLERCPRCGGFLVDCGCTGLAQVKERIEWTIDEVEIASLNDAAAASAIDALIAPVAEKVETVAARAGMRVDSGRIRYEVVRAMLIEMIRKMVQERTQTTTARA